MKTNNFTVTSWIVFATYILNLFSISNGYAIDVPHGFQDENAARYNTQCINNGNDWDCTQCDRFCRIFQQSPHAMKLGNDQPDTTWGADDDAICAAVGSPTTGGRLTPAGTPTQTPGFGACTISIPQSISDLLFDGGTPPSPSPADLQDSCTRAAQIKDRCTYRNSQVETQCKARNAAKDAGDRDLNLGTMDFSVAGICGVACAASMSSGGVPNGANTALEGACSFAATVEGALEVHHQIEMSTGETSQYIQRTLAPLGLTGGLMNSIGTVLGRAQTDAGKAAAKNNGKISCASAVLFAALGAIRMANVARVRNFKKTTCDSINDLLGSFNPTNSNSNTTGRTATGPGNTPPVNNSGTAGGAGGGGSSQGSGAGSLGSGGSSGGAEGPFNKTMQDCVNNKNPESPSCQAALGEGTSPEENILRSSPELLDAALKHPGLEEIAAKALGEGAGAALEHATGGQAGETGAALAGLAETASKDEALKEAIMPNLGASYSGGGGGGHGPSGGSSGGGGGGSPFGSLFGGGAKDAGTGARAPAQSVYGASGSTTGPLGGYPMGDDIWHSRTRQTLFEIVSTKLFKVNTRVAFAPEPNSLSGNKISDTGKTDKKPKK